MRSSTNGGSAKGRELLIPAARKFRRPLWRVPTLEVTPSRRLTVANTTLPALRRSRKVPRLCWQPDACPSSAAAVSRDDAFSPVSSLSGLPSRNLSEQG